MRAKSHDQRKGQWLINKIRGNNPKYRDSYSIISSVEDEKWLTENFIWNMENDEFDKLMADYNE